MDFFYLRIMCCFNFIFTKETIRIAQYSWRERKALAPQTLILELTCFISDLSIQKKMLHVTSIET